VLDVSCEPDGKNSHAPGIATATIAITANFRTSGRRRLCRAPNFRTCRPRWNCLTTQNPFAPRPRRSLPSRTLQSKLTVSA
jgi:hypothetical protein